MMKRLIFLLPLCCWVMLSLIGGSSCRTENPEVNPDPNSGSSNPSVTIKEIDTWSEHMQFWGANKKPGKAPKGIPGSSTLKRNIKDTLYLAPGVKMPLKFLHLNTSQNVAGVYVQVHSFPASTGGVIDASHYYEVPEQGKTNRSDTVSIVLLGFDPAGLILPLTFAVTFTPYDDKGNPLDVTTLPVKVEELNDDPNKAGTCGLVLPDRKRWQWSHSYIGNDAPTGPSDYLFFYSDPSIVFSPNGQWIEGSCCNGYSKYEKCRGEKDFNARLHFATYYQIEGELFIFDANGYYLRETFEKNVLPLPIESNFCGNGPGKVRESEKYVIYEGNWTIKPTNIPPDLKNITGYSSRNSLVLQGTNSSGLGFGNPGGVIHQLNCHSGYMVLIQLEREGRGRHLFKVYTTINPRNWYIL